MKMKKWVIALAVMLFLAIGISVVVINSPGASAQAQGQLWAMVYKPDGTVWAIVTSKQDWGELFEAIHIPPGQNIKPYRTRWENDHFVVAAEFQTPTATPIPTATPDVPPDATVQPTSTPTVGPTATSTPEPTPRVFSGDTNAELEALWLELETLQARVTELEGK